jgi:hypothetical protein
LAFSELIPHFKAPKTEFNAGLPLFAFAAGLDCACAISQVKSTEAPQEEAIAMAIIVASLDFSL